MKQFSVILNLVLLVAVGFLYYLHFSGDKKRKYNGFAGKSGHAKDSNCTKKSPLIAYVELDSLNNSVTFLKERKKELEAEQKKITADYESSYRTLEAQKNDFIQKKGETATKQEIEEFQQKLMDRQQQIESDRQTNSQRLAERSAKIMEDLQAKLKEFLNDYNKNERFTYILATGTGLDYMFYKDSALNITKEIVAGLNDKMKEGVKK